jgi:hypothetical protein
VASPRRPLPPPAPVEDPRPAAAAEEEEAQGRRPRAATAGAASSECTARSSGLRYADSGSVAPEDDLLAIDHLTCEIDWPKTSTGLQTAGRNKSIAHSCAGGQLHQTGALHITYDVNDKLGRRQWRRHSSNRLTSGDHGGCRSDLARLPLPPPPADNDNQPSQT